MKTYKQLVIDGSAIAHDKLSGVGYSLVRLIRAISEDVAFQDEYQVVVIVPSRGRAAAAKWLADVPKVRYRNNYFQNRLLNLANYLNLLPPMDMVYGKGVYFFPNFKNWPLTKKSSSITLIHDIAFALYPATVENKNRKMLMKHAPKWMARTDVVATVSESSKREIVKTFGLPTDKTRVLYNILPDTQIGRHNPVSLERARQKYMLPAKYTMFLSTIEPRKNIRALLDIYENSKDLRDEYPLLVCGALGWEKNEVVERIDRAEKAGWLMRPGYIDDLDKDAIYAGATLFVHPAIHEGFGIPPLEALRNGTKVLVNDIPVMHEVLGGAALYADFSDARGSQAVFQEAINAPATSPQQVDILLKRYSPSQIVEQFRDIIEYTWSHR